MTRQQNPSLEPGKSGWSLRDRCGRSAWCSILLRYGTAAAATTLAVLVRVAIDPYIHNGQPYFTIFVAVTAVAWFAGSGPALLTAVAGLQACDYFFVPPRHMLVMDTVDQKMAFVIGLAVTLTIIMFTRATRKAQAQALARQHDLELAMAERLRAEGTVLGSRAKLEAALESITDAVFISDVDGNFINFNEAFATFHKFKNKEQCAKTLAEYPAFLDVFMPDGTLAPLDMWAVPRALRGETATNAEYGLRRKDTGEEWIGSYSFAPVLDSKGTIVGSVVVGRDITEQKLAEAELRELEAHKREFYRRTILAATDGRLVVCEKREIDELAGDPVEAIHIEQMEDMEKATAKTRRFAIKAGVEDERSYEFLGPVVEAITNAVKHAGTGTVSFHRVEARILCLVSDSGPGIGAMALPHVALARFYSTAGTLGMGYKLMLHFADRVYLATGPEGTTVGIEMAVTPHASPAPGTATPTSSRTC